MRSISSPLRCGVACSSPVLLHDAVAVLRSERWGLDVGVTVLDLAYYLGEQPLLVMAKNMESGEYLWKFELWHSKALKDSSPIFNQGNKT